ncbi:MAG: NAD(P)H-dependent oxidoreductase [Candidatus Eremiobacteraeota bacterium]|nr:NAD(P)H-dependent oxidoreductase [Candidatus Eremiobacteraeota bacterium]
MNVLIVLAHPDGRSFNASLARRAKAVFTARGDAVRVSDLYRSEFDPCEGPRHFGARRDTRAFDVQSEQRFSWESGTLSSDVRLEIDNILWADLVILQFPLWWFGPPAILKGWMDRVFVYGGLYTSARRHDRGVCRGKKAVLSVTAGSAEASCAYDGREGDTKLILWPLLYALRYVGFTVLDPSIIYGVHGGLRRGAERESRFAVAIERYATLLQKIELVPAVPFNADSDWDENGKLKPGAIAYSPFIRHEERLAL